MNKIDQTEFGPLGNCYSACLAMVFGCPEILPNFNTMADTDRGRQKAVDTWLAERGWRSLRLGCDGEIGLRYFANIGPSIAGGYSSRGAYHGVVYLDGKLFHDPHPDRSGLVKVDEVELLLPLQTWRMRRDETVAPQLQLPKPELTAHGFRPADGVTRAGFEAW